MNTLSIKKGDQVKVLAGKDRGKTGKVLEVSPKLGKVVVEGLNISVRFSRPKRQGEKGQRMELPSGMPMGKVMLVCPHCGKPTRVGYEIGDNGKFRKCKQCGQLIN
ncbi:MAG: 50S ribosomal protein L24 [Candidatus Doudnabacteria bacterium]|nr:50S ribosomal protein L24 [Candidatus Doudnabacteria bacterium]